MEEKLGLSEPLRKRGRIVVAEGYFKTTRRLITGNNVSRSCSVILFNDILLRAYKSNKTAQYKLLDICPLNNLIIVDPQQTYASTPNSIVMCTFDPRGAILEFFFNSSDERKEWYEFLIKYTIPMNIVCKDWGINENGLTGKEIIFVVDNCSWYEAYIEKCRILVTRNYVILSWESFGITQNEFIPFEVIKDIEGNKDSGEIIHTQLWKGTYRLKKFNNYASTSTVLRSVWQVFKQSNRSNNISNSESLIGSPRDNSNTTSPWINKLKLTQNEIRQIWSNAKNIEGKEGDIILQSNKLNDSIFLICNGLVIQTQSRGGDIKILTNGNIFGIASFLADYKVSQEHVVVGQGGATILSLTRNTLYSNLEKNPQLLAKFFSTLALSFID